MKKILLVFILIINVLFSRDITVENAYDKFEERENVVWIDLRKIEDIYRDGKIPEAKTGYHYSYIGDFKEKINKFRRKGSYIIYDRSGIKSKRAVNTMKSMGFEDVSNLSGGFLSWKTRGKPIEEIEVRVSLIDKKLKKNSEITVEEAYKLYKKDRYLFIDIREKTEILNSGKIPNSINYYYLNDEDFLNLIDHLDRGKKIIIYSKYGFKGKLVMRLMDELGFKNIKNIRGGYELWKLKGYPTVNR